MSQTPFSNLSPTDSRIPAFVASQAAEINQYPIWGEVQHILGVDSFLIGIEQDQQLVGYAQVLKRKLRFGYSWWSVPRGPIAKDEGRGTRDEVNASLIAEIVKMAKLEKVVYIRFDWPRHFERKMLNVACKMLNVIETNFPSTTLVLDLTKSDEDLLKEMHPKGRYNIRLTEKQGVTVREDTSEAGVDIFYELLRKTTARDGFAGHGKKYYQHLVRTLSQPTQDKVSIFIAEKDATPLAAIIVTYAGKLATYYYGASDHAHRALMAPYACQWAAIRAARTRGCTSYDFLGIAPENSVKHELAGVTEFKRKFGGQVVTYPPSVDLILRPLEYQALKLVRKMRK